MSNIETQFTVYTVLLSALTTGKMKDVVGMYIESVMEAVASATFTAPKIEIALDLSKTFNDYLFVCVESSLFTIPY